MSNRREVERALEQEVIKFWVIVRRERPGIWRAELYRPGLDTPRCYPTKKAAEVDLHDARETYGKKAAKLMRIYLAV
jgi:hypothetical protein